MDAEQLAGWLKKEHKAVRELVVQVGERAAAMPLANHAQWIGALRESFEHFRAHLTKVMALKEKDGYLAVVVERRPVLSREVERLAHEHDEFTRLMNMIHQALAELQPEDQLMIRDCCHRLRDLLCYVEHHDSAENLMILSALNLDIGSCD